MDTLRKLDKLVQIIVDENREIRPFQFLPKSSPKSLGNEYGLDLISAETLSKQTAKRGGGVWMKKHSGFYFYFF